MGFFQKLVERREFSLARWESYLNGLEGGETATGIAVTDASAMTWSVVWACVLVKSQDIAKSPLPLYRRLGKNGDDGREEARDHPLWRVLRVQANPYMTAFQLRQTMQKHKEVTGNAYALKEFDAAGNIAALWPRSPSCMKPRVDGGRLVYRYTANGTWVDYDASEVFHIKGLSDDGIEGLSPVSVYREGIALGLGYQQYASYSFKNSVRPSLVAKTAAGPEKAAELGDSLKSQYAGIKNNGGILVGYGGLEFQPWGFSNRDAEFIQSRRFSVEDGCRIWRMLPHKIMDYSQSAYANITSADLAYVNDCLRPDQENWEEEIHRQLLRPDELDTYYVEHDNYDLLKGTPVERADVECKYVAGGISAVNEVRKSHNWKPVPGGDECRVQMQMVPLDAEPPEDKPEDMPPPRKGPPQEEE
jgi:HK97 family phage portal protein